MAKGAKRRRHEQKAVTHEEVQDQFATSVLFKSNLFKLQTAELLNEVSPFATGVALSKLESAVRALRDELGALQPTELSWDREAAAGRTATASHAHLVPLALSNASVKMPWSPPSAVHLIGSYLLRTCTAPELNVDVAIELPASCFNEKDYLDQRYTDKRQIYLAHLAHLLAGGKAAQGESASAGNLKKKKVAGRGAQDAATSSVVSPDAGARFTCLPHMQSTAWPVVQIQLMAPTSSSKPGADADADAAGVSAVIEGWSVRLIPCLAVDTFHPSKLRPQRCNLRGLGARPSPTYNNLLRLESGYTAALQALHSAFRRDTSGALRESTILLKVWLRQRYGGQAGAPSGFQLSLLLLHLMGRRLVTLQMSSYQILRVVLHFLKSTDLLATPIVLPDPAAPSKSAGGGGGKKGDKKAPKQRGGKRRKGDDEDDEDDEDGEDDESGDEDEDEDEDDEDEDDEDGASAAEAAEAAARAAATSEAVAAYRSYFPWVLTDAAGLYNFGCGVDAGALRDLSKHASASLAALDSHALSDAQSFAELLTMRAPLCAAYDAVLTIALPSADAALPAAAGVVTLPPTSADDLTDGADAAAAAAARAAAESGSSGGGLPAAPPVAPFVCGTSAVETVLALGLAERCEHIRAWRAPLASWDPATTPLAHATSSSEADGDGAHGGRPTISVGLWLEASRALGLVDRGPSPSAAAESAAWKALWGERSETRRFKDGAIVHSVVWEAPNAERHSVVLQAARHLLRRHLGVEPQGVRSSVGGLDDTLRGPAGTGLSYTPAPLISRAFDKLASVIRNLKELPLMVMAIQPTAAAFADLEPFPPLPGAAGAPPAPGAPALEFAITFETSGKWPDDLEAIARLKTAFYLKLAKLIEVQASGGGGGGGGGALDGLFNGGRGGNAASGLICEVRPDALFVQADGFTFCGTIQHDATPALLEARGDARAAEAMRWRTGVGARHLSAASALGRLCPAYPPTVRLAKRWLSCQMYTGVLSDALVALLAAHAFAAAPTTRRPATAAAGFARFLQLLAYFDFANEPLLLAMGDGASVSAEMKETAHAAFAAARRAAAQAESEASDPAASPEAAQAARAALAALPTIWIATDEQVAGADGIAHGPSWQVLRRLQRLAEGGLRTLEGVLAVEPSALAALGSSESGGGGHTRGMLPGTTAASEAAPRDAAEAAAIATDRGVRALVGHIFDAPTADFDAVLVLSGKRLTRAHLSWQREGDHGEKGSGKGASSRFANLRQGEVGRGVGEDPVADLVERLRATYGALALFFYDGLGGRQIALKWRPAAFMPTKLAAAAAEHRTVVPRAAAPLDAESGAPPEAWVLPNLADVLAGMVQMGGGLVQTARLPRSGDGLRAQIQ